MKKLLISLFVLVAPYAAMAGNVTTYPNVSAVAGSDIFFDWQSSAQQNCTGAQLKAYLLGGGTLSIGTGKTLTSSNTLTFAGTDGSTVNFGAGGTPLYSLGTGTTTQAWSAKLDTYAALASPGTSGYVLSATTGGTLSWIPVASPSATSSGTNTYTATPSPALAAYVTGQRVTIKFVNANTAGSSLNLNGLGAIAIQINGSAIGAGQIPANSTIGLQYDGTNFQIVTGGTNAANPVQNITSISNLTSNGFVTTSGGSGTLGVDTTAYQPLNTNLTTIGAASATTGYVWTITGSGTAAYQAAASYTLPTATASTLGGVMVPANDGISLDGSGNIGIINGQIPGTTTNDSASAGNCGETIISTVAVGSAVSLTTNMGANVTSVSLTASDWLVTGNVNFSAATATVTATSGGINSTSTTVPTDGSEVYSGVQVTLLSEKDSVTLPSKRFSLASTTTIYLVGKCTFSAGTVGAFGSITAVRIR